MAIQRSQKDGAADNDVHTEVEVSSDTSHDLNLKKSTYYMLDGDYPERGKSEGDSEFSELGLKVLARIPTCAVFHKLTHGRGVPHSFISAYILDLCHSSALIS